MRALQPTLVFLTAVIAIFSNSAPVFAHKLQLDCAKRERLHIEAFFEDRNEPAQNAKISVENDAGVIVVEGRTDDRGTWSCAAPGPGKYLVRVETIGHADKKRLVIPSKASLPETKSPSDPRPDAPPLVFRSPSDVNSGPVNAHTARERLTAKPWLKIAIGLTVIAGFFALLRSARKGEAENRP